MQKSTATRWPVQPQLVLPAPPGEPRELLSVLFRSSAVGVAICDRQFRFRAINDALAAMNGIPAKAHLGKSIHVILGKACEKVLPAFQHVFSTGQPVVNFEITAELPKRRHPGQWIANYLPIRNRAGHVQEIGIVIVELTKQSAIEACLVRLLDDLLRARVALQDTRSQPIGSRVAGESRAQHDPLSFSKALIEKCIAEALVMSRVVSSSTPSTSNPLLSHLASTAPLVRTNFASQTQSADAIEELWHKNSLSHREREVLALLASGKTNKQLADEMAISIRTVETYRARIMLKLGLHSVAELVVYAIRNGLAER